MEKDYDKDTVEFLPPEGYELPEGVQPDQEYDGLGTFKMKADGMMCLLKVGGLPVKKGSQVPEKSTGKGMVEAFKKSQINQSA